MKNNLVEGYKIHVGASSGYDVIISKGILCDAADYICKVIKPCTACIITDDNVDKFYSSVVSTSLEKSGFKVIKFVFSAGEKSKNLTTYSETINFLAQNQLTRSDIIVALGGGVTGDMAGFAAATYLRGIKFIQIATTLLAAIDSSVGGKTAVDLTYGKNLVGAFHQPSLVLCDTDTFKTLPNEIFSDGMGEFAKYAILDEDICALCEQDEFNLLKGIALCVDYKRKIVEEDEFEKGCRKLLNLGHTVAHGIEKNSEYTISHGSAVAMGLRIVLENCFRLAYIDKSTYQRAIAVLQKLVGKVICPYSVNNVMSEAVNDKKRNGDKITLVMVHGIGDVRLEEVDINKVKEIIQ